MEISANTKKIHRNENIARGVIWGFAGLTILILAWILGFILYRGFYSNNVVGYKYTDMSSDVLTLNDGSEVIFIANKGIRVKDLTADSMQELYTHVIRELNKWSDYTEQSVLCQPIAYKDESPFNSSVKAFLLGKEGLDNWKSYTTYAVDSRQMIEKVAETKGALGYIPAGDRNLLTKDVVPIPLRSIQVAMNSEALAIKDNRSFQEFTEDTLKAIFAGKVVSMTSIGGIGIAPLPAIAPNVNRSLTDNWFGPEFIPKQFDTMEGFYDYMSRNPGAVGLVDYTGYIPSDSYETVTVQRRERGMNLDLWFLIEKPAEGNAGGISYFIINTLFMILMTLLFSAPIGILAAVYLVEYAKQGPLVTVLRMGTETLAGIPSIVFGLFGRIFFVNILGMGIGFISSTLTVTLMILPTLVRTSEEALKAVPPILREGSMGLGATKWQTIFRVVLPAASQGILTGVILAVGRVAGETAVLLYTLGSSYDLVRNLHSPARVLSLHLYLLFSEAVSFDRAFATGTVLVIIVLITNLLTRRLIRKNKQMAGR
ncbi:MAG: phosphate ABC transporter permease PstA [Spirochaetales bacterium]|nr:phosphate ABC transporter permease PstA [Spirochaetales bacterium]